MNNDCVMCVDLYINEFLLDLRVCRIFVKDEWILRLTKETILLKLTKVKLVFFIIIILPVLVSSLMVIL